MAEQPKYGGSVQENKSVSTHFCPSVAEWWWGGVVSSSVSQVGRRVHKLFVHNFRAKPDFTVITFDQKMGGLLAKKKSLRTTGLI